jgi:hypothetical protein
VGLEVIHSQGLKHGDFLSLSIKHKGMLNTNFIPETFVFHLEIEVLLGNLNHHCLNLGLEFLLSKGSHLLSG